jgi:hypothetical protein
VKVGKHPVYGDSRCFIAELANGKEEDFSYKKCVQHLFPQEKAGTEKIDSKFIKGTVLTFTNKGNFDCTKLRVGLQHSAVCVHASSRS